MPELGPWNLLDHILVAYLKKSGVLVRDPQPSCSVLCDSRHGSSHFADRNKTLIFQVPEAEGSRNPDSSGIILKERIRSETIDFAVENRDLSVVPSVHAIRTR